ncbi:MAG: hypothetical protein AMXMBFR82_14940 [Candidatus Hydrogenedentota bacterium]
MLPVFIMVGMNALAHGIDYHVSPSGDDLASGERTSPWCSVERANAASFEPGDRLLFEGGHTYPGTLTFDAHDSGAESRPFVVSSYGEGRAAIDGRTGSGVVADGCDYLKIENINFTGAGRKNDNAGCGVHVRNAKGTTIAQIEVQGFRHCGVLVEGVQDCLIDSVHAHNNGSSGIQVGDEELWSENVRIVRCIAENNPGNPANLTNHSGNGIVAGFVRGCTIEYCEAMNNGWDMPREGNGPVGIWAWNADRVVIQHCISHDNKSPSDDGGGFDFDGGVTNSIMQYNLSYGNDGPGYLLCMFPYALPWKNNIIRYNISQNDGKPGQHAGIRIYWLEGMSDAEIYNNTVYNEDGSAVGFYGKRMPGMRFRNNIFVSGGPSIEGACHEAHFEGNLYWRLKGAPFALDGHASLDAWSAATGQERVDNKIVGIWADPQLVRPGMASLANVEALSSLPEYKLNSDSPCIGAGLVMDENGGRDFWGTPLPGDAKPSIGAYEVPQG